MHVLSRTEPEGDDFKVLGVSFDCKLVMKNEIHELVSAASWKLRTLLRTSRYYTGGQMVLLYKAHLLSFLEYRTPAVYHACDSTLEALNGVQTRFLREAGFV